MKSRPLERCRNKAGESPAPLCRHRIFASFRVDQKHHLMSFISKVVPSPDWIVGVSGFELCLRNQSWIQERKMNLYLYDAGTASGESYQSRPTPTVPQGRIRLVTASDHRESKNSPFYDPSGAKIRPFAMIHIRRTKLYKKSCEEEVLKSDRMLQTGQENLEELRITDQRGELRCGLSIEINPILSFRSGMRGHAVASAAMPWDAVRGRRADPKPILRKPSAGQNSGVSQRSGRKGPLHSGLRRRKYLRTRGLGAVVCVRQSVWPRQPKANEDFPTRGRL